MSLYHELKHRNVLRVGAAYIVAAWLVIQVVETIFPAFGFGDSAVRIVVIAFGVGLVPALVVSWVFEITPEGLKKEKDIDRTVSITHKTGKQMDRIIMVVLALGLGYFAFDKFVLDPARDAALVEETAQQARSDALVESYGDNSIAVLPFVNMSSDPEQEYFSDGISEELLNLLAKIPELRVISRSSSFSFKGKGIAIPAVAKQLNVAHVLEGSVRKAGNRVRITAQLIEARSDSHLWSETYDRELTDIFAIQDEITAAIVKELKSKLGIDANAVARDMAAVNLDAHNEYLKGRFYVEKRTQEDSGKALIHFEKAIEIAPDYAPAWMGKAWAILFLGEQGKYLYKVGRERAKPAAEKALQLDPTLPEAYVMMAWVQDDREKGIPYLEKAVELNPNYSDAYVWLANFLSDLEKRFALRAKALKLNPMSLLANENYASSLLDFGRLEEAETVAEQMMGIDAASMLTFAVLYRVRLERGNYAEATFYKHKVFKLRPSLSEIVSLVGLLGRMGLLEQAAVVAEGTDLDVYKYKFRGDLDLFISEVRANMPQSDKDDLGAYIRAREEARLGNTKEALKYCRLTRSCSKSQYHIFSLLQEGDTEAALPLLDERKAQFIKLKAQGQPFNYNPLSEIDSVVIACLEGDIEGAVQHLKNALEKGYIMNPFTVTDALFAELRTHPEWPTLLAMSNKRAAEQREAYLRFVAEEAKTTQ